MSKLARIAAILLAIALLIALGMISQKKHGPPPEVPHIKEQPTKVDLEVKMGAAETEEQNQEGRVTTFFYKPGPEEIWEKMLSLKAAQLPLSAERLADTEIIWQLYFYKVLFVKDTLATISFDTVEHGFGLEVQAEVDTLQYPQLLHLEKGKKIWLAGEITGADAGGTGTVFLHTEYVSFSESPPVSVAPKVEAPKKKGEEKGKHGEEKGGHGEEKAKHGEEKKKH